jgi:hypothetical protein
MKVYHFRDQIRFITYLIIQIGHKYNSSKNKQSKHQQGVIGLATNTNKDHENNLTDYPNYLMFRRHMSPKLLLCHTRRGVQRNTAHG